MALKYLVAALAAGSVFAMVFAIVRLIYKEKLQVERRMNKLETGAKNEAQAAALRKSSKPKRERKLDTKLKVLKKLANEISLSGMMIRASEFLVIWLAAALVPSGLCLAITGKMTATLAIFAIGLALPPFILHRKKVGRVDLFEKQLVEALVIICNCLKSGLTFQQALVSISNEMPDPISKEFGRVVRELKLGMSVEKALGNMSERLNSQNFMFIVSAVLIQRQTGGNLSEILSNIASTIKERHALKSEIKVLTATGRTSGMVIGFLPVGILLLFMVINPDYVNAFFDSSLGIGMLIAAAVLEALGYIIIKNIVNIKY